MKRMPHSQGKRPAVPRWLVRLRGRNAMLVASGALVAFSAILVAVERRYSDAIDIAITLRLQAERRRSLALLMEAASWPSPRSVGHCRLD